MKLQAVMIHAPPLFPRIVFGFESRFLLEVKYA